MFKKYFLLIPSLVLLAGCTNGIPGSGVSKTETRNVGEFRSISNDGIGNIMVKVGEPQSVTVTFDDNLLSLVETKVVDGELQISTKESFSSKLGLDVQIVVPQVEGLKVTGVGAVNATGIDADELKLELSGVGNLKAEGKAKLITLTLSGVGSADLKGLEAASAKISASGVGSATVFASESIDIHASGVGSVKVFGNPKEQKTKADGIGKITIEE